MPPSPQKILQTTTINRRGKPVRADVTNVVSPNEVKIHNSKITSYEQLAGANDRAMYNRQIKAGKTPEEALKYLIDYRTKSNAKIDIKLPRAESAPDKPPSKKQKRSGVPRRKRDDDDEIGDEDSERSKDDRSVSSDMNVSEKAVIKKEILVPPTLKILAEAENEGERARLGALLVRHDMKNMFKPPFGPRTLLTSEYNRLLEYMESHLKQNIPIPFNDEAERLMRYLNREIDLLNLSDKLDDLYQQYYDDDVSLREMDELARQISTFKQQYNELIQGDPVYPANLQNEHLSQLVTNDQSSLYEGYQIVAPFDRPPNLTELKYFTTFPSDIPESSPAWNSVSYRPRDSQDQALANASKLLYFNDPKTTQDEDIADALGSDMILKFLPLHLGYLWNQVKDRRTGGIINPQLSIADDFNKFSAFLKATTNGFKYQYFKKGFDQANRIGFNNFNIINRFINNLDESPPLSDDNPDLFHSPAEVNWPETDFRSAVQQEMIQASRLATLVFPFVNQEALDEPDSIYIHEYHLPAESIVLNQATNADDHLLFDENYKPLIEQTYRKRTHEDDGLTVENINEIIDVLNQYAHNESTDQTPLSDKLANLYERYRAMLGDSSSDEFAANDDTIEPAAASSTLLDSAAGAGAPSSGSSDASSGYSSSSTSTTTTETSDSNASHRSLNSVKRDLANLVQQGKADRGTVEEIIANLFPGSGDGDVIHLNVPASAPRNIIEQGRAVNSEIERLLNSIISITNARLPLPEEINRQPTFNKIISLVSAFSQFASLNIEQLNKDLAEVVFSRDTNQQIIKAREGEIDRLLYQNAELNSSLETLSQQLQNNQNAEILNLNREIEQLRGQINELSVNQFRHGSEEVNQRLDLERQINDKNAQIGQLQAQNLQEREANQIKEAELQFLRGVINEQNARLSNFIDQANANEGRYENQNRLMQEASEAYQQLIQRIQREEDASFNQRVLQEAAANLNGEVEFYRCLLDVERSVVERFADKEHGLVLQVESLKNELALKTAELLRLEERLRTAENPDHNDLVRLREEVAHKERVLNEMRVELEQMQAQYHQNAGQLASKEHRILELLGSNAQKSRDIERLTAKRNSLDGQLKDAKVELDRLNRIIEEHNSELQKQLMPIALHELKERLKMQRSIDEYAGKKNADLKHKQALNLLERGNRHSHARHKSEEIKLRHENEIARMKTEHEHRTGYFTHRNNVNHEQHIKRSLFDDVMRVNRGTRAFNARLIINEKISDLIGRLVGSPDPALVAHGYSLITNYLQNLSNLSSEELESVDVNKIIDMIEQGNVNRMITAMAAKKTSVDDTLSKRISDLENTVRSFINITSQRTAHVGAAQAYHPPRRVFVGRDGVAHQGNRYARGKRSYRRLPPRRADGRFKRASPVRKYKK